MTKSNKGRRSASRKRTATAERRGSRWRWVVALIMAIVLAAILFVDPGMFPGLDWGDTDTTAAQTLSNFEAPLASFYEPGVSYWQAQIVNWARQYGVNPNVIAIVIQIESCGNPVAISSAGAVGLMQIMPFHFEDGENQYNPDTNVARGMAVFYECLSQFAEWDLGVALACYNGGPSVTVRDRSTWAPETQYYYQWATGLWDDVVNKRETSETLRQWLDAGGATLCDDAARALYPPPTLSPERNPRPDP